METFFALLALCEGNPSVTGGLPDSGQWRGALMFSLICAWTNGCANNRDAGDLRCHRAHYDVTVMRTVSYIGAKLWNDNLALFVYTLDEDFYIIKSSLQRIGDMTTKIIDFPHLRWLSLSVWIDNDVLCITQILYACNADFTLYSHMFISFISLGFNNLNVPYEWFIHTHINAHTHTHTHAHTYIYIYIYIYTCNTFSHEMYLVFYHVIPR